MPIETMFNRYRLIASLRQHHYLLGQLVYREVLARYRGSVLGIGWSFLYPLLLLFAYTLIFGGVFGGNFQQTGGKLFGTAGTALFIYCGLAVFTPFSEIIGNAPRLLFANQNFVKKIVFPTEMLPLASVIAATIHGLAQLGILIAATCLLGHAQATMMLIPVILLPALLAALGLAWFLAAAGAFVRDLAHGMPIIAQLLVFLMPVFYPIAASPGPLLSVNRLNPIAVAMDDLRQVVLNGSTPDWSAWLLMCAIGTGMALFGHAFFTKCQEEFADVL